MSTETSKIHVSIVRETGKSYLLKSIETDDEAFFPKSQISFDRMNHNRMEGVCVVPVWLLEAKGW